MTGQGRAGRRPARETSDAARFGPPSSFGMDRRAVAAERARLKREGWADWEIDARLPRPQDVPTEPPT